MQGNLAFSSKSFKIATFIVVIISIAVTVQSLLLHSKPAGANTISFTQYNNYIIFKQSFFHLLNNKDLYQLYLTEYWDYFKYSPTFALLMAPFAVFPDFLGLFFWNLLNGIILFYALWKLPLKNKSTNFFVIGFVLIELITSLQNSQSNALIAGLLILAFTCLERRTVALATLFIVLTIFIKLFGIVALSLLLCYPGKLKAALYTLGWTILLGLSPLLVISYPQLIDQYKSWFHLLHSDYNASVGLSVAGWLYTWFGINLKNITVMIGAVLFCLPFLKYNFLRELKFRLLFLSSILIWIIIFNHKAESPTFIIAACGIAIWFVSTKKELLNTLLLAGAFIFTILSATDIFPSTLREHFVTPYVLKAVPCILIWFKIIFDMMIYKPENYLAN